MPLSTTTRRAHTCAPPLRPAAAERAALEGWAQHSVAHCCNSNRVAQFVAMAAAHTASAGCGEQCAEAGLQVGSGSCAAGLTRERLGRLIDSGADRAKGVASSPFTSGIPG